MDRGVKIAVAAGVILIGTVIALLFRHEPPRQNDAAPGGSEQLVLRKRVEASPNQAAGGPAAPGTESPESGPVRPGSERPATVLTPVAPAAPLPPGLATSASPATGPGTSQWGISMGLMLPERDRSAAGQTHKIVDGDTLPALAQRYLGSAERAGEIFEANRDVLGDPQILPIGAELKIPAPPQRPPAGTAVPSRLAPVR